MPLVAVPGARLACERRGSGPPLLLIQGVGTRGCAWAPQVEELADRFHCVSFDNRGLGDSAILDGRLSIEAMADDALALCDALGLGRVHVVGHSMGGLIAQRLALMAPGRVRSLALLCTFTRGAEGARFTPGLFWSGLRMHLGPRPSRRRAFLELVASPDFRSGRDPEALADEWAQVFGHDLAERPAIAMRQLQAMGRYDESARAAELGAIPTLVVAGGADRIALPAYGRALAAAIPGARFVELAAGHAAPVECPAAVNALLAEHAR